MAKFEKSKRDAEPKAKEGSKADNRKDAKQRPPERRMMSPTGTGKASVFGPGKKGC